MIALVLATGLACGGSGSAGKAERTVVAAFYPLAYAAERLVPPGTAVRNLTPPGVEPHDFELSARDVSRLADADAVLYLGEGFQPALEAALGSTGAHGVDLLAELALREPPATHEPAADDNPEDHGSEGRDPHVWLDPRQYARVVERIAVELGRPEQGRVLVAELEQLDREFARGLHNCARRELVTSHDAFGYLADRYGLEQVALTGLSPEAEPTPGALRELIEEVRERGATTIFFETLVSPRLAETVARDVGARAAVLNPLEGLTEDELARGEDYFSVMRANLAALRLALGCRPQ
ncbi:MAG: zinc ABC transporter substrate-binding protein [Actinobacteria bacterium]|nr:zinc ABC transporter substrate-binding protein [Actinomycetota bacterium]